MFLLFLVFIVNFVLQIFIYIPICFYYFCNRRYKGSRGNQNLHSNMFLLFLKKLCTCRLNQPDLHSNMFLLFLRLRTSKQSQKHHLHSNMFLLFQSISSLICPSNSNLHSNMFLLFLGTLTGGVGKFVVFTFQYVFIISYEDLNGNQYVYNLHSNMFLLFQPSLLDNRLL